MSDKPTGVCGELKGTGEPCENPVKYADGKCGIHTDVTDAEQGRPTKFTDERARAVIRAAKEGKSKRGCERAAGVGEGTVRDWLKQSHTFTNSDGLVASFSRTFADARAQGESMYIQDGRREDGDTSFAKFMLSSSYGYKNTEKREHEHSGDGGGPIEVVIGGDEQDHE